jgi:hypothetical protein
MPHKDPEARRVYHAAYRAARKADADRYEEHKEYQRQWKHAQPPISQEEGRARYAARREANQAKARAFYAANRERSIAKSRAWQVANPDRKRENGAKWAANNPEWCSYKAHRGAAKQRGVPFLLTFDEWLTIWRASGKFAQRGRASDEYCMARCGDQGAYAIGNVRICTNRENATERWQIVRQRRPPLRI